MAGRKRHDLESDKELIRTLYIDQQYSYEDIQKHLIENLRRKILRRYPLPKSSRGIWPSCEDADRQRDL